MSRKKYYKKNYRKKKQKKIKNHLLKILLLAICSALALAPEQAEKLILDMLAGGAKVLSRDIDKAAAELGISARTVRQAKQKLGKKLHSERSGTQWILSLKNKAQRGDDAAGLPLRHLQIPCTAKRYRRTGAPSGGCWINI